MLHTCEVILSLFNPCQNRQSQDLNNDVAWSDSWTVYNNIVLGYIRGVNAMHAGKGGKVKTMLSRNCVSRTSVRGLFIKITLDKCDFSLLLLRVIKLYF